MRLATLKRGGRDGTLVAVSADGCRMTTIAGFSTLQALIEAWDTASVAMRAAGVELQGGGGEPLQPANLAAPLPRAWQWLDGSAFATHGQLMQRAFGLAAIETDKPLMYQGMSHQFIAPYDDVVLPSEADGIDFEGEFGVVTDDVPMGCKAGAALAHIRLIVLINDWSLRAIAPIEMKTGFGWVQAKPACTVAPFAVTPDELGSAWQGGRVHLPLNVHVNKGWFGSPNGDAMSVGFHELIEHAAYSRSLPAGTVIGSGTVSNLNHDRVGSSCISERRAIEMIERGAPQTPFLHFGDRVQMEVVTADGLNVFGTIDQRVAAHAGVEIPAAPTN